MGQEDMVLCYLGILHSYRNSHHTPVLDPEEEAHSFDGCLQQRVVEVALQELAGKPLEAQVLEAQEGMSRREEEEQHFLQQAPALELHTGHGKVVLHSQEQEERLFVPAVQPENLMS